MTVSNKGAGIYLGYSNNNSISSSTLSNNGIYVEESYNNTVTDTTVNGKPLVYLENAENLEVNGSSNAGQVILVNCSNMTVKDVILNNATAGLQVWSSENIKVTNITSRNNQGSGIRIVKSSNITVAKSEIRSNNLVGMGSGINIVDSSNITVSESIVTNNKYYGLEIYRVHNLTLQNNQIVDNCGGISGAELYYVAGGLITGNNVSENTGEGLAVYVSENLEIRENRISDNNYDGILLHYSSNNIIEKNEIQNNSIGISLHNSDSNRIIGNRIYDSRHSDSGIHLYMSNSNLIEGNRLWNNTVGLSLDSSSGNLIYNNHFNNTVNVTISDSQSNTWNTSKTEGTNIVGGNRLGGNYWGSPDGKGFSDICADGDGDGICDQPFVIDEDNTDQLPLTKPAPPPTPTPSPTPTPTTAVPHPIGGGGGGGSYITGSGVYQTAMETVKAGESHEIALPQSAFWDTGVFAVIVKPEDSVNIRFRIEKLKDLPVEITKPTGMIAAWSIKPTMSKYTSASGKIVFGISIQEIKARGFDPNAVIIILLKWDGSKWIELPTKFVSSDGKYNYYEAETPSFSYFAAVIKVAPTPTPKPITPPVTTPPATTPTPTAEKPFIPGFEAALAVTGLIALAYLLRRRHG